MHPAAPALRALLADRRAETEAVLDLVQLFASSRDVRRILDETITLATSLTGCVGGFVYLLDEHAQRLTVAAATDGYEQWIGRFGLDVGAGLTGWTALNRTPVVIPGDARGDPRNLYVPELHEERYSSTLTYPLLSPRERLVGVLTLHAAAPHEVGEDDLRLVAPVASLAAAAVESADLARENLRRLDIVNSLSGALDAGAGELAPTVSRLAVAAREVAAADGVLVAERTSRGRWSVVAVAVSDGTWSHPARAATAANLDPLCDATTRLTRQRHGALMAGIETPRGTPGHGLAIPLRAGGEVVGVLICVGGREHGDRAGGVLDLVASIVAQTILVARLLERASGRTVERRVLDEIAAGDDPEAVLVARASRLGLDLTHPHIVVALRFDQGRDPEATLRRVRDELRAAFAGAIVAVAGGEGTAIVPLREARAIEHLRAAIERAAMGATISAGLSRRCVGVPRCRQGFSDAQDALDIGRAFGNVGRVVRFEELGASRYLWDLAADPARDETETTLEHLQAEDSELFDTLDAFLARHGNRQETAAALAIHRNTLRQRLTRIRGVTGLDVTDAARLFDLQVAIRIVRIRTLRRALQAGLG